MTESTIIIQCATCGIDTLKRLTEVNRQQSKGRIKFYCTQRCATIARNKTHPNINNLRPKLMDEFSPFREYLRRCRRRFGSDEKKCDITLSYLKELWEKQSGKCAFTGIPMIPDSTGRAYAKRAKPTTASLDRIDSSKGYEMGNVQFVCLSINLAKQAFSHEEFVEFLNTIRCSR